jgi:tubulin-specific chaperone A
VTAVSIYSYWNARESLKKDAQMSLRSVSKVKTEYIRSYFSRMLTDLQHESEKDGNVEFLEDLRSAFEKSGKPLGDFMKSFKWVTIVDERGADLKNYRRIYGYHDIFLIDAQGNILFTVAGEDDLGTNLFKGKYSHTLFAKACKKALETGRPAFSDFEFYTPSNNAVAGFLVNVLVSEDGDKSGLLAFQIQTEQIDPIIQESSGLGKTAETYLVGADLRMRSNSGLAGKETILREPVETEQTLLWQREHAENGDDTNEKHEEMLIYDGPHGKRVLGMHNKIEIAGVPFAVIAEIEEEEAFDPANRLRTIVIILLIATGLLVLLVVTPLSKRIVRPIMELSGGARLVAAGRFDHEIRVQAKNEIGELSQSFNNMLYNLRQKTEENELQNWFKTGQAELNDRIRGEQDLATLGRNIITCLADYLKAQIGAIYLAGDNNHLKLVGSYAFKKRKNLSNEFEFGEGLVGQAALEKDSILLTKVPSDYIAVSSGLGEATPHNILVKPFLHNGEVKGVVELGTLHEFSDMNLDFLNQVAENIAVAVHSAQSRQKVQELLEQTQKQAEELQTQQEELRTTNEELEEQAKALKESEARLQVQQEELQQTNEELEEQTKLLEEQKQKIQQKNLELEKTRTLIEEKARDLEITGKYKSEFLANMSHELRTPLNSILLLSKLLSDNKDGNLTEKQVEFSRTINSSGSGLLNLINDVLDLSKVEAGRMELHIEDVNLMHFAEDMKRNFQHIAQEKGLNFSTNLAGDLPQNIRTDCSRVEQIVKNFFSNSFKFTSQGSVTLNISRADHRVDLSKSGVDPKKAISFSVSDTGVGIPKDKQKLIFEAFQQGDGTTNRKFGGTGLGLSISREMAKLLGGEIQLQSEEGKGSTFSLFIPETLDNAKAETRAFFDNIPEIAPPGQADGQTGDPGVPSIAEPIGPPKGLEAIADDRRRLSPKDKSILIIEDDPKFAEVLRDLSREKGFKVLIAGDGETGLHFADYYKPSAIILDIGLPGIDGWTVMSRLKDDPATRHIPVHFISASDSPLEAIKMGGIGYLTKPVSMENLQEVFEKFENMISKSMKNLLLVEDDENQRKAIVELIGNGDVRITGVSTGQEAYDRLSSGSFDCVILDLGLPDMSGVELLKRIRNNENLIHLPIIIYTGKDLTKEEEITIDKYAEKIIIKGVRSAEKLFDETTLFLHRVEKDLPEEKQRMLRMIHDKESILNGKKILLVDDDMRNVYALTNIIEEKGVTILLGKTGKEGLELLNKNSDIALILMDIMMPEMDGYEAMREIRKQERFKKIPIIALTAKAMKGDRAKCIEAGASDYLAKPVDADKLLSMLRVWLY